jgi:decaprenyl-phosphate phosphoribosyltransferase
MKTGNKSTMRYIRLLRPHQYVKNFFIFAPLFFAGKIAVGGLLWSTAIAFTAFSLTASSVYILNDYKDIDEDREHPSKRSRPLASGTVTKSSAFFLMTLLFAAGSGLALTQGTGLFLIVIAYAALNIAYSFGLKHIPLLDIFLIAVSFVLRLFAGSVVTGIALTEWIIIMVFLLALFLALAKRRDDVLLAGTGRNVRRNIDGYNIELVTGAMTIMASIIMVSYLMFTLSPQIIQKFHSNKLYFTSVFVLFGILRYMQITIVEEDSGDPTRVLLKDGLLQITIIAWLMAFALFIY